MPKIFPIVKKVTIGGTESDQTISVGTENHDDTWEGELAAQSLGGEQQAGLNDFDGDLNEALGQEDQSMAQADDTGSQSMALGQEAQSTNNVVATLNAQEIGQQGASWQADSVVNAQDEANTASRLDLAGTPNDATWQNPNNAKAQDGVEAGITRTGQLAAATGFSDELRLEGYTPGGTPSGWTQTVANLIIRHRWETLNPGLDLLSTCDFQIVVRYTDATEDVIFTKDQASANQAALLTETYDISNRVITQGKVLDRVMFRAIAAIAVAQTGTTKSWNVDAARLEYVYTRVGIA